VSATPSDWLVWQLTDSAFPIGGFVHSGGLEAAWQHGEVRNRAELREFIEAALRQTIRATLPFVAAAFDGAAVAADRLCEAFTSNHVANRASRLQGRALVNSVQRTFQQVTLPDLPFGHLAPACGSIFAALRIIRERALRIYLFMQLRGWISSAVRLNIIGPMEAQSLQAAISAHAETLLLTANLSLDRIAQTAPILEIFQASHDRLYSRLFQS
jgi:urease accessory protein